MTFDLLSVLPQLLPRAIEWAEARSIEISSVGKRLNGPQLALARTLGVASPEHIRVSIVSQLPLPEDPELQTAAIQTGLLGPGMVGLTLGYGIYICDGHLTSRLLSHEFRHVYQYEQAGSISAYLSEYLEQIAKYGYDQAPFEVDARDHELGAA